MPEAARRYVDKGPDSHPGLKRAQEIIDGMCASKGIASIPVRISAHPILEWSIAAYDSRDRVILMGRLQLQKPHREVAAMLAHELAHHVRHSQKIRHWLRTKALSAAVIRTAAFGLACYYVLTSSADILTLAATAFSILAAGLCISAVAYQLSLQRDELICDRMGWQMTGDPASSALTLAEDMDDEPAWRPWHTHPPTRLRIRRAEQAIGTVAVSSNAAYADAA